MKNIIVVVLIICLLLQFTGCYTPKLISKEELVSKPASAGLVVKTNDQVEYYFEGKSYTILNDSISGNASLFLSNGAKVELGTVKQIDLTKAESIKLEKIDPLKTVLAGAAAIGLAVLLSLGIKSMMEDATKNIASKIGEELQGNF